MGAQGCRRTTSLTKKHCFVRLKKHRQAPAQSHFRYKMGFLFFCWIEEQFVYVTLGKALQIALYNLAIYIYIYIYSCVYIICIYTHTHTYIHFLSLTARYKLLRFHSCRERNLQSEATSDKTLHVVCAP